MKRLLFSTLMAGQMWLGGPTSTVQATIYNSPPDPIPPALAGGDVLNVLAGTQLPQGYSAPAGSVVNLLPGGEAFYGFTTRGVLNLLGGGLWPHPLIDGGTLNASTSTFSFLDLKNGATLNVDGAAGFVDECTDSTINMYSSDDSFGLDVMHLTRSILNIYGLNAGKVHLALADRESVVNIVGGGLSTQRQTISNLSLPNSVNVHVMDASIDGLPIPGLSPGTSVSIVLSDRNLTLLGHLRDGSSFDLTFLRPNTGYPGLYFSPGTVLRVIQVPEPMGATGVAIMLVSAILGCRRHFGTRG